MPFAESDRLPAIFVDSRDDSAQLKLDRSPLRFDRVAQNWMRLTSPEARPSRKENYVASPSSVAGGAAPCWADSALDARADDFAVGRRF